ncbi:hypothetical protein HY502_02045 [Candidatus Woesebacteria bacterium]|nr:hypothetical protein [Candidatus Woesebacteria bacterium]
MTERHTGSSGQYDKPVFIQGLFRSRTTFVASKFAEDSRNKLIIEPLHPSFGQAQAQQISPKSLRHPPFKETSLAKIPEDIQVPIDLGIKRYYLKSTEAEPEVKHYFNQLIASAEGRPVFKFVRMALRGEWLKQNIPGVHIYVDRDLSGLINSYYSFRGRFSWYLSEFVTVIGINADNPVFGGLAHYLGLKKMEGNYHELKDRYRRLTYQKFQDDLYSKQTMVDMIAFFRELAVAQANTYANTIITTNDLRSEDKRHQIAEELTQLTGTIIDFSDYRDRHLRHTVEPSLEILTIIKNAKAEMSSED